MGYRILLVENDESLASRLAATLAEEGYLVEHAAGSAAATELAAKMAFDAIVLEVVLPDVERKGPPAS